MRRNNAVPEGAPPLSGPPRDGTSVVYLVRPDSAEWPGGLSELRNAPGQLYVAGSGFAAVMRARRVGIVGTRAADASALAFTYGLAAKLVEAGVVVVSGGALGIDRSAHAGACDANGVTVAVLATGLARPYPRQNRALFRQLLEAGSVLCSEVETTVPAQPGRFLARNRIIAALSEVVVVVQAPQSSGALSTAAHARKLGRPVMSVPCAPWDTRGRGSLNLLTSGAMMCSGAADVLAVLSQRSQEGPKAQLPEMVEQSASQVTHPASSRDSPREQSRFHLSQDARVVLQEIPASGIRINALAQHLSWTVNRVQVAVLELRIDGSVEEYAPGSYRRGSVS